MKVIDLLNKISKGEEVPKKIRIREVDYNFTEINTKNLTFSDRGSNINYAYENDFENYWLDCARINEEIEIIEEEKEIEEIDMCTGGIMGFDGVENITGALKDKINELVREINKLKNK